MHQHAESALMAASGNVEGHVLPGVLFLLWGMWWLVGTWRRGDIARAAGAALEADAVLPWVKIALTFIGMIAELPRPTWYEHDIVMNLQHVTMYAFFGLSGVVDLLARRGRVSPGATYLAFAAACANAGMLFVGHGGQGGLEHRVHSLLALLFFSAAGLAVAEWMRPDRGLHWLRMGALIALGSWFCQIGWMLFLAGYDLADPVAGMRAYLFFSWHVLIITVVLLTLRVRLGRGADFERGSVS